MSNLVRICGKDELPEEGLAKEFSAGGKTLCVANVDGVICALDNVCPHRGGPLAEGLIEEGMLVCPWHGWTFNPSTGQASHNPHEKVAVYDVTIRGDEILVEIE